MDFKQIYNAFEMAGFEPQKYSGRAMYGSYCLGVTTDNTIQCVLEVIDRYLETCGDDAIDNTRELIDRLFNPREDSMGLRSIIYWPRIKWPDNFDPDEDDFEDE